MTAGFLEVDVAQHGDDQVDDEDVVGIGEETSSGGDEGADGEPVPGLLLLEVLKTTLGLGLEGAGLVDGGSLFGVRSG